MEETIAKLLQYEEDAAAVLKSAESSRKLLSDEYDRKVHSFDDALEKETAEQIRQIREAQEDEKEACLNSLREETDIRIRHLEDYYENRHSALAAQLMEQLLR